ncbi:MAG: hypothetical protein JJU46_06135 [Balneolaceae bacterium]|nr:hypothetical protein [Balneolaceae bacterium]MCH8547950.1 hypothetical protein [Balneolaceae bacterium]
MNNSELEKLIRSYYPEAKDGKEITRECMDKLLSENGFVPEKTILGTSVCSDEIVRTATNFRDYLSSETPFSLGGLAGFPFTGVTGFHAFAGHIPDDGFAVIQYGPHIGISASGHIGSVMRIGQHLETTCCGALKASVGAIRDGSAGSRDNDLDYQQWKLEEQLSERKDDIMNHEEPLKLATDLMFEKINHRIKKLLEKSASAFKGNKVALVGGIIINTDHGHPDWFDLREFSVESF